MDAQRIYIPALPLSPAVRAVPRGRVREKDRDPYDGLRPWSAITHGAGAQSVVGIPVFFPNSAPPGLGLNGVVKLSPHPGQRIFLVHTDHRLMRSVYHRS